MRNKIEQNEKFEIIKESLECYLNEDLNVWISVKKKSISNILKDKGLHKSMTSSVIKVLLNSKILEKRGQTASTEYMILRKPTNLTEIIENVLKDNSKIRNNEYVFGKERLELGKKYYMVFDKKIFEIQVISVNIRKNNEVFYHVKKQINSTKNTTVLKNIEYKDVYLTVTSAGEQVKNNAIKDCTFMTQLI